VRDRCIVCVNCTISTEIILDEPDGTPRFEAQVESHFCLFGDCANLDG
jgi:hypothetical protein